MSVIVVRSRDDDRHDKRAPQALSSCNCGPRGFPRIFGWVIKFTGTANLSDVTSVFLPQRIGHFAQNQERVYPQSIGDLHKFNNP